MFLVDFLMATLEVTSDVLHWLSKKSATSLWVVQKLVTFVLKKSPQGD